MIALILLLAGVLVLAYLLTAPALNCPDCRNSHAHVKPEPWSKP